MKFEKAYKGVSRIYTAQILELLSGIFAILVAILAVVAVVGAIAGSAGAAIGSGIGAGALVILALIFGIIAFFLTISGINSAGADEPIFKSALLWLIIGIIAKIVQGVLTAYPVGKGIVSIVVSVASILETYYIVMGITSLADKLGNSEISAKGNSLLKMIIGTYVVAIILNIIAMICGMNSALTVVVGVLGIIVAIVSIVAYILFLVLLSKAKKMLAAA